MQNTESAPIVGVFRDHAKADQAVEELKQAGYREDQITSRVVSLHSTPAEQTPENTRIVVTVRTDSEDNQAFGILFNNGANNADLPSGMALIDGKIAGSQAETVDLVPEPTLEATFDEDSYFGEVEVPGRADEPGILDNR
ncbi:MAG TPA: hypothetical protein VEH81_08060 [Ktedonobacteraceae bacterium]|nr:hypothetical protein [Ktedonobacteraceae bacterium]